MSRRNARIIRKAKQVLISDGWTQGELGAPGRPHCVLGAFREAEGLERYLSERSIWEASEAARAFGACIGRGTASLLIRWNDNTIWRDQDVIAKLEECAQQEEAKELPREEVMA